MEFDPEEIYYINEWFGGGDLNYPFKNLFGHNRIIDTEDDMYLLIPVVYNDLYCQCARQQRNIKTIDDFEKVINKYMNLNLHDDINYSSFEVSPNIPKQKKIPDRINKKIKDRLNKSKSNKLNNGDLENLINDYLTLYDDINYTSKFHRNFRKYLKQ